MDSAFACPMCATPMQTSWLAPSLLQRRVLACLTQENSSDVCKEDVAMAITNL